MKQFTDIREIALNHEEKLQRTVPIPHRDLYLKQKRDVLALWLVNPKLENLNKLIK
jgi:hypothetical protein